MKIRRYYNKNVKYERKYYPKIHDMEEFSKRISSERLVSEEDVMLFDNAEHTIELESEEEEATWFFDCLDRVYRDPRWYLDNLDKLPTFKVRIEKIFPEPIKGPGLLAKNNNGLRGVKKKNVYKSRTPYS